MRKSIGILFLIVLLIFSFLPNPSFAHALSAAFTTINISSDKTELTYSIDALSVIEGIGGDKNDDSTLSDTELEAIKVRVREWVEDSVVLEVDGKEQAPELMS